MALDLILGNARLANGAGGSSTVDIGIAGAKIAAIDPNLEADCERLDAEGRLVSSGLVETHIHLDKSRILDRCSPSPDRGRDHMARVGAIKHTFTVEDVYERARQTLEECILNGTTHMRTHVEVDPNVGMKSVEALQQLAKDYAWAIDLELCVFAQEGMSNVPEADKNVEEGLKRGAPVVGGAPGYDPDHAAQITRVFDLAREYDTDVDLHLDVGSTTDDMDIHLVCDLTEKYGMGGRVAIGHGSKYSCLPPDEFKTLAKRLADTGVTVTVLPATDLFVMGRERDHNVIRGVPDANALIAHGVNCCLSTNNVLNPFTPFGDCSLMRIANLYANIVQRGSADELDECFEMMTHRPADLIGRDDYGVEAGKTADLVVWDATSANEAVSRIASPLFGFKNGRRTFSRTRPELHRP
ncbi:MAG: amidohydrolase family protein [Hyphomicrobiaceae bacterium]|nr:amidohydrolase family protein [Hyphomicrobiaceae bacterium]